MMIALTMIRTISTIKILPYEYYTEYLIVELFLGKVFLPSNENG